MIVTSTSTVYVFYDGDEFVTLCDAESEEQAICRYLEMGFETPVSNLRIVRAFASMNRDDETGRMTMHVRELLQ